MHCGEGVTSNGSLEHTFADFVSQVSPDKKDVGQVLPAQKVKAILQGQIGKEVQNDKTNSPLLAGQGEVLKKEHSPLEGEG